MPYVNPRGRYWNRPGKSFEVIGDPNEPAARDTRLTAADLVDTEDPAFGEILRAGMDLIRFDFDLSDPEVAAKVVAYGRKRHEENNAREIKNPPTISPPLPMVVYYMRIGNRVKIGTSYDIKKRLSVINPEELMVTEDGSYDLERMRHKQFKELRTHGEWFRLEDPLTSHIEMLRRHVEWAS